MKEILINKNVIQKLNILPMDQKMVLIKKLKEDNLNEQQSRTDIEDGEIYKYHASNEVNIIYTSSLGVINIIDLENISDRPKITEDQYKYLQEMIEKEINNIKEYKKTDNFIRYIIIEIGLTLIILTLFVFNIYHDYTKWLPIVLLIVPIFRLMPMLSRKNIKKHA